MEIVFVLVKQLLVMFIYLVIGYVLFKKNIITRNGSREMGSLLLYVLLPCVIFSAYGSEMKEGMLGGLAVSFLFALLALILAAIVSGIIFGKKYRIENFAGCYSNAGYMGIPLIRAVLGNEAVFYASSFVALLNVLQWTYGVVVMTGDREKIRPQKILKNPSILAFVFGLLSFLLQIRLPEIVQTTISSLSAMNGPVAMIILGCYLAQIDLRSLFNEKRVYLCSAVRLLLVPVLTVFLLLLVPAPYADCRMSLSIIASAPVAAATAIFAQQYELSYTDAVKDVCLSTVLSLITMPLIVMLAGALF